MIATSTCSGLPAVLAFEPSELIYWRDVLEQSQSRPGEE